MKYLSQVTSFVISSPRSVQNNFLFNLENSQLVYPFYNSIAKYLIEKFALKRILKLKIALLNWYIKFDKHHMLIFHLYSLVLQSKSIQCVDGLFSIFWPMIVHKSISQTLTWNNKMTHEKHRKISNNLKLKQNFCCI